MNVEAILILGPLGLLSGLLLSWGVAFFAYGAVPKSGRRWGVLPETCSRVKGTEWAWPLLGWGAVWAAWFAPLPPWGFWGGWALLLYLLLVSLVDLESLRFPTAEALIGLVLGLVLGIARNGLNAAVAGGLVGWGTLALAYGVLALLNRLGKRAFRGDSAGIPLGWGDVRLAGVLGLVLGMNALAGVLFGLMAGAAMALVALVVAALRRQNLLAVGIPYAPALAAGCLIALVLAG
mgnify:CR=1 FL=1